MKLIEIKENNKKILFGSGDVDIKSPIQIKITIEKNIYDKIEQIAKEYKWSMYEAIEELICQDPEEVIRAAEMKAQGIKK